MIVVVLIYTHQSTINLADMLKLINSLLVAFTLFGITSQASISDKKDFDVLFPPKYHNTVAQLLTEAEKISGIKQLVSETPFVEIPVDNDGAKRKSAVPTPKYPSVDRDMKERGYRPNMSFYYDCKWYSITAQSTWSLDDNENHATIMDSLPDESEWADTFILPKGREINILFILMDMPDIEKNGKFRTYHKPDLKAYHGTVGKMALSSYKREQARAEKAIAHAALSGYACISFKEAGKKRCGWVKLNSLLQNTKEKKKKKR